MIYTTQTQTILASAVPHTRPEFLDSTWPTWPIWMEAGMREQRRSGLSRTMFCVRLLEQGKRSRPEERLAFLVGAFIAADLDALVARQAIVEPALITGGGTIAEAWRRALQQVSVTARIITSEELEQALLMGLQSVSARWMEDSAGC
jgi:2-keto-3-deoxy-galactonokinase